MIPCTLEVMGLCVSADQLPVSESGKCFTGRQVYTLCFIHKVSYFLSFMFTIIIFIHTYKKAKVKYNPLFKQDTYNGPTLTVL